MNSKGFVTIIISGVAALLFVLGFVTPFYWFLGDPMIFLAGYASLMLIVIAFVLNVKTGSYTVGLTMMLMGAYGILFGYNTLKFWSAELAKNAGNSYFMGNLSGQNDFAISVIMTGLVLFAMGIFSTIRKLSKIKKIENKSVS